MELLVNCRRLYFVLACCPDVVNKCKISLSLSLSLSLSFEWVFGLCPLDFLFCGAVSSRFRRRAQIFIVMAKMRTKLLAIVVPFTGSTIPPTGHTRECHVNQRNIRSHCRVCFLSCDVPSFFSFGNEINESCSSESLVFLERWIWIRWMDVCVCVFVCHM